MFLLKDTRQAGQAWTRGPSVSNQYYTAEPLRSPGLSVLIRVQTVCKGYQQLAR